MRSPGELLSTITPHQSALDGVSPLKGLLHLWQVDRELVYQLGVVDLPPSATESVKALAELAHVVRDYVRQGFQKRAARSQIEFRSGATVRRFPKKDAEQLAEMIRAIDTPNLGKLDRFKSTVVSEEEVAFRLGHVDSAFLEQLDDERKRRPIVLRVDPEDLESLRQDPAYVTHSLTRCVPRVLASPTSIYKGIRRDGRLQGGYAFCGLPGFAMKNDGARIEAPKNKIFCVYVTENHTVFDWDWIQANPENPREPSEAENRFVASVSLDKFPDVTVPGLEGVTPGEFKRNRPWASIPGDCVFMYFSDELAFADRENEDLTVFRRLKDGKPTGFKVKNFDRIVQDVLADAERTGVVVAGSDVAVRITVHIDTILLSSMLWQAIKHRRPAEKAYDELREICRDLDEAELPVECAAGC